MSIYKDCDIRGLYGNEFDEVEVQKIGKAIGTLLDRKTIVVCGDVRESTDSLKAALIDGLLWCGANVIDIGIAPTPVAYYAKSDFCLGAFGLAVVTASHNPAEYNGVKIMLGDEPIRVETIEKIHNLVLKNDFVYSKGEITKISVLDRYKKFILKQHINGNKKVVVDCGSGTQCLVAPELLKECGFDVVPLFCEVDGKFKSRNPNPAVYKHLSALSEKVSETGADFGVAFDGDGDRAVFADENGTIIPSEKSLVVMINALAGKENLSVVYDQKCSSIVPKSVKAAGGTPIMERSGHIFIKDTFLKNHSALAGEISGHYFFGELGYDDGLYAALIIGSIISSSSKKFSEICAEIPDAIITPDIRIPADPKRQDEILKLVETKYCEYPISRMDGIRINFSDGWMLIRKSVTEPVLTLRIEADSHELLKCRLEELQTIIPELNY